MWLFADIKVRRIVYNLLIFNIFYFFIFENIFFAALRAVIAAPDGHRIICSPAINNTF